MNIAIKLLEKEEEKEWDNFVFEHPGSTFYHQIGWKNAVELAFHHKPIYLVAKESAEIVGILPLFVIRTPFIGTKLISIPFTSYGGTCAINSDVEKLLVKIAIELTKEYKAKYLELRQIEKKDFGLVSDAKYVTFMLDLSKDEGYLWRSFSQRMRRYIRKAEKLDYEIKIEKDVKKFYGMYSKHLHQLGTPIEGYKFFDRIASEFDDAFKIVTIFYDDIPVSSLLLFYFRDKVIYDRGVTLREYRDLNLNYALFWETLKILSKEGIKLFDFGRSIPGSGTFSFKSGWNPVVVSLHYQYYLYKYNAIPDLTQDNHKRQKFARIWKKIPISLANIVGPELRKYVP